MKFIKYLLIILIILITAVSCSSNVNEEVTLSGDLLSFEPPEGLKPDEINVMNIFKKHKSGETEREITLYKKDQIIMDDLIEELSEIKLKKLNEKKKINCLKKKKLFTKSIQGIQQIIQKNQDLVGYQIKSLMKFIFFQQEI